MSEISGTAYAAQKGSTLTVGRAVASLAASTTDGAVVAAVAGKSIRVLAYATGNVGTASQVTFNSKPAGAGAAISHAFPAGQVSSYNPHGWFQTVAGEGLSATSGAGSVSSINVVYIAV